MSFKINEVWECMQCGTPVIPEEAENIREMFASGKHSQVEFTCEECGDSLTADTTDCPEGEVAINSDWVYD